MRKKIDLCRKKLIIMNPVIIQRKNLQKKLWEDLRPRNEEQVQAEITYQRYGFYDESGFNLPIEADTTPALYNLCQSVKERLKVQDKVVFQIDNRANVNGGCIVSGNNRYPSIIHLSSGAVNTLSDDELTVLVGHEIGHLINKDGIVRFYYNYKYKKDGAPKKIAHQFNVYRLLAELEADRYAYLACGNLDTCISYQYKRIGGIDINKFGVPASQFIEGNRKRVQMFINGRMMGSNEHPYDAIRTEALYIFATSKDARELSSRMYPLVYYIDQYTD